MLRLLLASCGQPLRNQLAAVAQLLTQSVESVAASQRPTACCSPICSHHGSCGMQQDPGSGQHLQRRSRQLVGCTPTASLQPNRFSSTTRCSNTAGFCTASQAAALQANSSSSSSNDAAEQSKAITRLIRAAGSIGALRLLVQQHSDSFNAINIAAAFTRAQALCSNTTTTSSSSTDADLAEQQQLQRWPPPHAQQAADTDTEVGQSEMLLLLVQQLDSLWQQQLQHAAPRELASVLLACSKLPHLSPRLWGSTVSTLLQQVEDINSQDASTAAYAMALAAAANSGHNAEQCVPGLSSAELSEALLTLAGRVWRLIDDAATAGELVRTGRNSSGGNSSRQPAVSAQAVSNILWASARLGTGLVAADRLSLMLQGLATPQVLATAKPLALVNTLWAVSELMQLPGWSQGSVSTLVNHAAAAADTAPVQSEGAATSGSSGSSSSRQKQQRQQQLLPIIPPVLLSEQQLDRIARSSSQAVSNTVLALSRFASGPLHLLDVPTAQSCIRRLLQGPTAAALGEWNAQDIGNAVFAVAQVGAMEPSFLQAVMDSAPHWLPQAGPATVIQVALGLARLKQRHCSELLEALVQRGKQLLLQVNHHQHHRHAASTTQQHGDSSTTSSSGSGNPEASGLGSTGLTPDQDMGELLPQPDDHHLLHNQQQQQHMCECLAADLSYAISALNNSHLAREIEQLVRASGLKQESRLHPKNARRLWVVHAWLVRHKLAGGHGLSRLLTDTQLGFCASASRHTLRVTPPRHAGGGVGVGGDGGGNGRQQL